MILFVRMFMLTCIRTTTVPNNKAPYQLQTPSLGHLICAPTNGRVVAVKLTDFPREKVRKYSEYYFALG